MTGPRLQRYSLARQAILERAAHALEADIRVEAAWLAGSVGRGEGDVWADFDLHVIVAEDTLPSFLAARDRLYASIGTVALIQDQIPGQPGIGDRFQLVHFSTPDGPVEIDWSFVSAGQAVKPVGHQLLFERRSFPVQKVIELSPAERGSEARQWSMFFWAMAPIAVRLCGRGDLERAVMQVRLLRRALICLWRLLEDSDAVTPWDPEANRPLDAKYDSRIPKLKVPLLLRSLLDAVETHCDQAEELQEGLRSLSASIDAEIITQTRELIVTARREIETARFSHTKYR